MSTIRASAVTNDHERGRHPLKRFLIAAAGALLLAATTIPGTGSFPWH
jgi:hypothetical protein